MRSAIQQIIMALDKTENIRVTSIVYNGENILFDLNAGGTQSGNPLSPADDIEKWLSANDPDKKPSKGHP